MKERENENTERQKDHNIDLRITANTELCARYFLSAMHIFNSFMDSSPQLL